jgi:hypothetical protein
MVANPIAEATGRQIHLSTILLEWVATTAVMKMSQWDLIVNMGQMHTSAMPTT